MSASLRWAGDKFTSQLYFGWKRLLDLLYASAHLFFPPLCHTVFTRIGTLSVWRQLPLVFLRHNPRHASTDYFPLLHSASPADDGEIWLLAHELCISMKLLSGASALPTQYRSPPRPHPSREQGTKLNFLSNSGASFLSRQQMGDTPSRCQGLSLLTPFTPGTIEEKSCGESRLSLYMDLLKLAKTTMTINLTWY